MGTASRPDRSWPAFVPDTPYPIVFLIGNIQLILSPSDLGTAVRRVHGAAGLWQDGLAGIAGVGIRLLIELEAGEPTLQFDKILAMLAALGVALRLMAGRGNGSAAGAGSPC